MARTIPEVVFRNVFIRWSPILNRTVLEDTEHSSKNAAISDILDVEATGYEYSHRLYLGDGQPRRVSLLFDAMLLEAEIEAAETFVPTPQVGVSSIAA